MAKTREISGVLAASSLLKLPDHYTKPKRFRTLHLSGLRLRVRQFTHASEGASRFATCEGDNELAEEHCTMWSASSKPVSIFEHYQHRGSALQALSLFEYCMTVEILSSSRALRVEAIEFAADHPSRREQMQQVIQRSQSVFTITLLRELFRFEEKEKEASRECVEKAEI